MGETSLFRSLLSRVVPLALALTWFGGCAQTQTADPAPARASSPSIDADVALEPTSHTLLAADRDASDWVLPGHGYGNDRFVVSTLTKRNVATLGLAWSTRLADAGEQEAAPIVWHGTMFVSTPHNHIVALDAKTGALRWDSRYAPASILDFAANRGVGIADGKIFIATQDCRVRALDARTGKEIWNVVGCSNRENNWYSMPATVYKDTILVGVAGGDFGGNGSVQAFAIHDGKKLWQWDTIPAVGQPGHETWPGTSWKHGGAALWGGLSVDAATDTLFIAPGNPGPDFSDKNRKGKNLYSDSIVALDIAGARPKMKWYYRIVESDTHDADPAMPPVLFEGTVRGVRKSLLALGDKGGNFVILDRSTGAVVHKLVVSLQSGLDTAPDPSGKKACPNHGGGVEWLGGAYDPATNNFFIPVTQECGVFKSYATDPPWMQGQNYRGGPPVKRQDGTGLINAVNVSTGAFAWRTPVPYPAEGGTLVTSTGLVFTSDLAGNVYAMDAKTGSTLWHRATGTSIVAPFSSYRVGDREFVAVVGGDPGNQRTPNLPASKGSYVMAFSVGATHAVANGSAGQSAASNGAAAGVVQAGTVPYTTAQLSAGKAAYATSCAQCHGAQLQGVSAPALAGSAFAKSHLSVSALRTVVTKQMPLTAPGSLSPAKYAAILAYLVASNCVKASGGGTTPFPTSERPAFATVVLAGTVCPVK